VLETGDVAVHDEQVEPPQDAHRLFGGTGFTPEPAVALAGAGASLTTSAATVDPPGGATDRAGPLAAAADPKRGEP
jgi:hypothetical protein